MTFEKIAVVLDRNRRLGFGALAASIVMAVLGIAQMIIFAGSPNLLLLAVLPLGAASRVWSENWRARPRTAHVRAGSEGVFVDGVRVISPHQTSHALLQPRPGKKPTVRLRKKSGRLAFEMEVEDDAEGIAFLRAIGQDAAARKATFKTMSPFFATRGRTLLTLFAYLGIAMSVVLLVFALAGFGGESSAVGAILALLPLLFAIRGRKVEVGTDGLSLTWNTRRRFIRFDDIASIEPTEVDAITVNLENGEKIPLRTGGSSGWDGGERAMLLRDALLRRILEAMEAHRANVGPRELAAQLASAGRDENAWLADLRKLHGGEGNYRAAAVREEDLWRVVEDPGAPEEARAAAALLLRRVENARPRLRIAAEAVASPKLRIALEAEEEAQAEEALKAYARD